MFVVKGIRDGECALCQKADQQVLVVDCQQGTFQDVLLCVKDFAKFVRMHEPKPPALAGIEQ